MFMNVEIMMAALAMLLSTQLEAIVGSKINIRSTAYKQTNSIILPFSDHSLVIKTTVQLHVHLEVEDEFKQLFYFKIYLKCFGII